MAWPTSDNPKTQFVSLRLTPAEMSDLNTYATTHGISRSEAVRLAVETLVSPTSTDGTDGTDEDADE